MLYHIVKASVAPALLLAVMAGVLALASDGVLAAPAELTPAYTRHIAQLSRSSHGNSIPLGLRGTDLGVSSERGNSLVFLFGDSFTDTGAGWFTDSLATAPATLSEPIDYRRVPYLTWQQGGDGRFAPIRLGSQTLAEFSTPVEGIALTSTFAFFVKRQPNASQTSMAARLIFGTDFDQIEEVTTHHFQFVQAQSDPDGYVYVWGTGNANERVRESDVYLARVPLSRFPYRAGWTYWRNGQWVADEHDALPLFTEFPSPPCKAEISVRWHPTVRGGVT